LLSTNFQIVEAGAVNDVAKQRRRQNYDQRKHRRNHMGDRPFTAASHRCM